MSEIMIIDGIWTPKEFYMDYSIDEYGGIYHNGNKLAWHINENGYATITLHNAHGYKYYKVHRLVMYNFDKVFHPFLTDVNHKDGNKLNNHISNLEWCTRSYNIKHAYDNGLHLPAPSKGEKNGNSKYTKKVISKVIIDIHNGKLSRTEISEKYGIPKETISAIKTKRIWRWLSEEMGF